MKPAAPSPRPECLRCRSYFVTWEAQRPHGCRLFAFKSQLLPRDEVRLSTGEECRAFTPRFPGPQPDLRHP